MHERDMLKRKVSQKVLQGHTSSVGDYGDFNCDSIRRQTSPEQRGKNKIF